MFVISNMWEIFNHTKAMNIVLGQESLEDILDVDFKHVIVREVFLHSSKFFLLRE